MADDPQTGGGASGGEPGDEPEGQDPFARFGLPFDISGIDLNEAMRILQSPGPLNWEIARQTAEQVALERGDDDRADESITEATRAELTELARAAVGQVVTETGLDDVLTLPVDVIDRRTWARRHLDGLRPVLETLATTMQDSLAADLDQAEDQDVQDLTADMLGMPMGAAGIARPHGHARPDPARRADRLDDRLPGAVRARRLRPAAPVGRRAADHVRRAEHRPLRRRMVARPA